MHDRTVQSISLLSKSYFCAVQSLCPQWVRCPVCRHPFTVLAQSERLQQDEEYFVLTAGIQHKFKVTSQTGETL